MRFALLGSVLFKSNQKSAWKLTIRARPRTLCLAIARPNDIIDEIPLCVAFTNAGVTPKSLTGSDSGTGH